MIVEMDGQQLVLDPGSFTKQLPELTNVVGIIVTHEHIDHLSVENLNTIFSAFPDAPLYVPQDVFEQLGDLPGSKIVAQGGESTTIGAFEVTFTGGQHATIYKTSPCQNIGVIINGSFYHPGDSLDRPNIPIDIVAVPASAPWSKTSEVMDFIADVKAKKAFPAHDMILSDIGKMVTYRWLEQASSEAGTEWAVLGDGESLS